MVEGAPTHGSSGRGYFHDRPSRVVGVTMCYSLEWERELDPEQFSLHSYSSFIMNARSL